MQRVEKPWGYEIWWAVTDKYAGKLIHVNRGQALSLQYHERKQESIYIIAGEAELVVDERTLTMSAGDALTIFPGTRHRIMALSDLDLVEVSTPELDDVVRLEDRYGREGTSRP